MTDVFRTDDGTVELIVNGTSRGRVSTGGQTVGQFVTAQAHNFGLKSFSVYVNGSKFFTEQASNALEGGSKVELVAKDARGLMIVDGSKNSPVPAAALMQRRDGETPAPVDAPTEAPKEPVTT